jgi:hypothetical protein
MTGPTINSGQLDNFLSEELNIDLQETEAQIEAFKQHTLELSSIDSSNIPEILTSNLNAIVAKGNNVLDNIQQICNSVPDPEAYNAAASVLNSINNLMSNFISIYKIERSRADKVELAELQHQHRLEQIQMRNTSKGGDGVPDHGAHTEMVNFNTVDVISEIIKQKKL